jgi:hypothetical protein
LGKKPLKVLIQNGLGFYFVTLYMAVLLLSSKPFHKESVTMKTGNIALYPERHIKNTAYKAGRILSEDQIRQIMGQVHQNWQNTHNQGQQVNREKRFKAHLTFLVKNFIGVGQY